MTKTRASVLRAIALIFTGTAAWGQSASPGHVNYLAYAQSNFDTFTFAPLASLQQWIQKEFASMVVFSPYFDIRTYWYPNAAVYQNLYAIDPNSWVRYAHPEWILKDQYGNWLYIPFNCAGGTCPMLAGDIANPAFRAYWITSAQQTIAQGNYRKMFIDDVNMEFRVSDGWGNQVAPIDTNNGSLMSYDSWRYYVASFTEQIRGSLPYTDIMENSIWFAGPAGVQDADPYIQRQYATSNRLNLERGIASDPGLTGGTGPWSVYAFFNYVDRVHALGKGVNYQEYSLDTTGQEYGLASYFLISTGNDSLGDQTATPSNWWSGYDVELGSPTGGRTYSNGIFQRNFTGGIVLLAEPGLAATTIKLPGSFQRIGGKTVTSVTLSGWQGAVLVGNTGATASTPSTPSAPSSAGTVTRYLSDVTANYIVNGWGSVQYNLSNQGSPLTINGVQYAHGLGVHAYSEMHWPLYGGCSSFTATVGVDDEVPAGYASVAFQVWADGKLLYNGGTLQSGSPAGNVNVNLAGYQTLSLVVTNGVYMSPSNLTTLDHADWANPVIVCSK